MSVYEIDENLRNAKNALSTALDAVLMYWSLLEKGHNASKERILLARIVMQMNEMEDLLDQRSAACKKVVA